MPRMDEQTFYATYMAPGAPKLGTWDIAALARDAGISPEQAQTWINKFQVANAVKTGNIPVADARSMVQPSEWNYAPGYVAGLKEALGMPTDKSVISGASSAGTKSVSRATAQGSSSSGLSTKGKQTKHALVADDGSGGGQQDEIPGGSGSGSSGNPTYRNPGKGSSSAGWTGTTPENTPEKPLTVNDLLSKYASELTNNPGAALNLAPGTLTLATLLGKKEPASWLQPGAGYGDTMWGGGPSGRVTYWNQQGAPFKSGQDQVSYWYNKPDLTWYRGDMDKTVSKVNPGQLPWQQVPWLKPTDNTQYYNAAGRPFTKNDPVSYWYNPNDVTWYSGQFARGGNPLIEKVKQPPWLT